MTRPLVATIDLDALRHNFRVVKRHVGDTRVFAIVKADAYGHGLIRVARSLPEADGFGVLQLEEALALREAGHRQRILMLEGFFDAAELIEMAHARIMTAVHNLEQVRMLETASLARPLDVFIKLNTGMNRLGFSPRDYREALSRLAACRNVGQLLHMTHFASADEPGGTAFQLARLEAFGAEIQEASFANSAVLVQAPALHADWVRAGIMLYGASPLSHQTAAALDLRPVMTLSGGVIAVQDLVPGDTVGYGRTFTATAPLRIGIVACGYADGYPRHAPTGTPVLVDGIRSRLVGRVSMDMLAVDLGPVAGAGIGSTVTLWGAGLPVEEVAAAAGTISYEVLAGLMPRVRIQEQGPGFPGGRRG